MHVIAGHEWGLYTAPDLELECVKVRMVNIPAICEACGAAFPSGFAFENCRNIGLFGNSSGPCPRCGGMGRVLDGVFNITADTIEILLAPEVTHSQLDRLANILKHAAKNSVDADKLATELAEKLPELSLGNYIPKNATELIAWLTFILLAIQSISQLTKDDRPDINVILNQSIDQSMQPQNYYPLPKQDEPTRRNSICECGSRKRYKHCCGTLL